jgi:hypothetical protein
MERDEEEGVWLVVVGRKDINVLYHLQHLLLLPRRCCWRECKALNFKFPTWTRGAQVILQPMVLGQFAGRAERRIDLHGRVEFRVVNFVALLFLVVRHDRFEAMAPEDLLCQVAATGLRRLPRRLHRALQNDDNLKALLLDEIAGRHVVQRRVRVDLVAHHHGPDEEEIAGTAIRADGQLRRELAHDLALLRCLGLDQLRSDVRTDDVALAHVTHSKHQRELAIALANDGVSRKEQRLRAILWPRHFCKHYANLLTM